MPHRLAPIALALGLLLGGGATPARALQAGDRFAVAAANLFLGPFLHAPAVAVGSGDAFLVAWQEEGTGAVLVRALDATGEPRGEAHRLDDEGPRWASQPRPVALPDGGYLVIWLELIGQPDRLMARLVDDGGSPLGTPVMIDEVTVTGAYDESAPAIAVDPEGTVTVAWGVEGRVRSRRVRTLVSPEATLVLPVGAALDLGAGTAPRLAALPGGGFLAAWMRLWLPVHLTDEVVLRAFTADGTPRGDQHVVHAMHPLNLNYGEDFLDVRLAADAAGRAMLLWHEASTGALYGQRFIAGATSVEEPRELVNDIGREKVLTLGDLAARRDGPFLLTWTLAEPLTFGCPQVCEIVPPSLVAEHYAQSFAPDGTSSTPLYLGSSARGVYERVAGAAGGPRGWVALDVRYGDFTEIGARRVSPESCATAPGELCLAGRFRLSAAYQRDDLVSAASPLALTADTGSFWFFSPGNVELVAKVVDGTAVNGHLWVFFASLTDVELDLTVVDHSTGERRTYHNPAGTLASQADVEAFR